MKTLEISAGKRTRILRNFSNSIPMTYNFSAESMAKGKSKKKSKIVSGKIEVRGSKWIFPRQPLILDLKSNNLIKKRAWDSFYSIYVTPDIDTRIVFKRTRLNFVSLFVPLLIGIVVMAIAVLLLTWKWV